MRALLRGLWSRAKTFIGQVEAKVKAQVSAGSVAAVAAWVLGRYVYHGQVPESVNGVIEVAAPVVAGAIAGWLARHTYRPGEPIQGVSVTVQPPAS